jgi:hypothetical protein
MSACPSIILAGKLLACFTPFRLTVWNKLIGSLSAEKLDRGHGPKHTDQFWPMSSEVATPETGQNPDSDLQEFLRRAMILLSGKIGGHGHPSPGLACLVQPRDGRFRGSRASADRGVRLCENAQPGRDPGRKFRVHARGPAGFYRKVESKQQVI